MLIGVDDPADERLDDYRRLRARESDEILWAEGPTVVERLLRSPLAVRSILATARAVERLGLHRNELPVFVASQAVINEVVGFDLHRGVIAAAERPPLRPFDEVVTNARRLVILEGLNDPENLGAIGRSARALGADGLILDPTCADPFYRRSVRTSMGELLHLPIARLDLGEALDRLGSAGWDVWALTPRADAAPIGTSPVPDRLALLVGAEGPGLSEGILARHHNVRIPIRADVDSLNVGHAVAAALAVVRSISEGAPP
ncbi:MAG: hypothetical protein RI958_858 [Actinomycetota bacterium]|jgi:tRNA G18 (ribose-2'-O)-methylase SpoU